MWNDFGGSLNDIMHTISVSCFRHEGMCDVWRIIDGEADSDEQVDGRYSVDCQVPEVHTATNVNLHVTYTRVNVGKGRAIFIIKSSIIFCLTVRA